MNGVELHFIINNYVMLTKFLLPVRDHRLCYAIMFKMLFYCGSTGSYDPIQQLIQENIVKNYRIFS
jgi:hypothetical protein